MDQNITITITNKHLYIRYHEVNHDLPGIAPKCAINENLEDTPYIEEGDRRCFAPSTAGIPGALKVDLKENFINA